MKYIFCQTERLSLVSELDSAAQVFHLVVILGSTALNVTSSFTCPDILHVFSSSVLFFNSCPPQWSTSSWRNKSSSPLTKEAVPANILVCFFLSGSPSVIHFFILFTTPASVVQPDSERYTWCFCCCGPPASPRWDALKATYHFNWIFAPYQTFTETVFTAEAHPSTRLWLFVFFCYKWRWCYKCNNSHQCHLSLRSDFLKLI